MILLISAAGPASASFFIFAGIVMIILGTFLSLDFRGIGTKYITLFLRKGSISDKQRARMVRNYKAFYAISAVLGIFMVLSGINRLS